MAAYSDYLSASIAFDRGDHESALAFLERSALDEDHFKTRHMMYRALTALGRHAEAAEQLAKSYALNPRNDRVACDHAPHLAGAGDVERARCILVEVLERNPSYGPAKRALADLDTHGEAPSARLSEE